MELNSVMELGSEMELGSVMGIHLNQEWERGKSPKGKEKAKQGSGEPGRAS